MYSYNVYVNDINPSITPIMFYGFRDAACKSVLYDYANLPDCTVIFPFFNEPNSTIIRSLYYLR